MSNLLLKTVLLGLLLLVVYSVVAQRDFELVQSGPEPGIELDLPELSDSDFDWIAAGIYQNEAAGQSRNLTYWGQGEDFPSFGIGHFIWFPTGVDAPFDEMFPDMFAYVRKHAPDNLPIPVWMESLRPFDSPWADKQQFDQSWSSSDMRELREWLESTAQYQARFIVSTFEQRWRDLDIPVEQKQDMTLRLKRLAGTAEGLFAIIDYYNFKGLGINPRERYQSQGWGLIQVLEAMAAAGDGDNDCSSPVEQFRQAAASRLRTRVELSPPERNEKRWMEGWLKRLKGYIRQNPAEVSYFGPGFRVRPYLQNPQKNAVTLSWLSNDKRAGQVMVWQQDLNRDGESLSIVSDPVLADALVYHPSESRHMKNCPVPSVPYLHEVQITGLEAGTNYQYEVIQDDDRSEDTFQTAHGNDRSLRFIVYGDSETEPESTGKHAAWQDIDGVRPNRKYPLDQSTGYTQNLQVIKQRQPAFVAIAGDLVQSGGEQRDWDEFWLQNASLAASVFIIPSLGNHDYFGGPGDLGKYAVEDSERAVAKYKTYFDLPDNGSDKQTHSERYYALHYGVITLIVLDGTNAQPDRSDRDNNWRLLGEAEGGVAPDWQAGSEQYRWLQNELIKAQRNSQFNFVMFHNTPWTSGIHGLPPGDGPGRDILSSQPLQLMTPLFIKHGVDAVFGGHDEMYEHSVVSGIEETAAGNKISHDIHFFDVGIGGDGLRGPAKGVLNPHQVFLAHTDAPEIYGPDGVLKDGGKHYGHLEVNVERRTDGQWQAQLDAIYVFPLLDEHGRAVGFERRLYDDSHILIANPQE